MTARHTRRGFTLVEILIVVIILGILAAIVIPQFTSASEDARNNSVQSQLQGLRAQIQLYKLEHADEVPELDSTWNVFLNKTNILGTTNSADGELKFGPYLTTKPVNPLNGSSTVADSEDVGVGWVYNRMTGDIRAVKRDGTLAPY